MAVRSGIPVRSGLLLLTLMTLGGCATNEAPRPAQFWGGVGFSYEANKITGKEKYDSPKATTHVGFEKDLGNGLGVGAEVAGIAQ